MSLAAAASEPAAGGAFASMSAPPPPSTDDAAAAAIEPAATRGARLLRAWPAARDLHFRREMAHLFIFSPAAHCERDAVHWTGM